MKNMLFYISLLCLSLSCKEKPQPAPVFDYSGSTFKCDGYTLSFTSNADTFSQDLKVKFVDLFFETYPKLVNEYNSSAPKVVSFMIDTAYHGVAATWNNAVHYDPTWFISQPKDIDVVTHEIMHIVQQYGNNTAPWWLVEGIADYVRNKYGKYNAEAGWTMPAPNSSQLYDNGYRVTARFLTWIENKKKAGFVKTLNEKIRLNQYDAALWQSQTGKNVADLWAEYLGNPTL